MANKYGGGWGYHPGIWNQKRPVPQGDTPDRQTLEMVRLLNEYVWRDDGNDGRELCTLSLCVKPAGHKGVCVKPSG